MDREENERCREGPGQDDARTIGEISAELVGRLAPDQALTARGIVRIIAPAGRRGETSGGGRAQERPRRARGGKGGALRAANDHAPTLWSLRASLGQGLTLTCATSLRCASLYAGMPIFRLLWTVETGASIMEATADVPPSASMIVLA